MAGPTSAWLTSAVARLREVDRSQCEPRLGSSSFSPQLAVVPQACTLLSQPELISPWRLDYIFLLGRAVMPAALIPQQDAGCRVL